MATKSVHHIYPKCSDILTAYHTCPKIWTSPSNYLLMYMYLNRFWKEWYLRIMDTQTHLHPHSRIRAHTQMKIAEVSKFSAPFRNMKVVTKDIQIKVSERVLFGSVVRVLDFYPGRPEPKDIKLFSGSTQQSMKLVMLINLKLLTNANSFLLNIAEHENFSANKYENANFCWHFHIY